MNRYIEKIKEIPQKVKEFFEHPIINTFDWFYNTYDWFKIALENWDMELYDFVDQLKYMFNKTCQMAYIITDKIRALIGMIGEIIGEILKGFRGSWK